MLIAVGKERSNGVRRSCFHFNISDEDHVIPDPDGEPFDTAEEAVRVANETAEQILRDRIKLGLRIANFDVEIYDDTGCCVARVALLGPRIGQRIARQD